MEFWGDEETARYVYAICESMEWKWTPQEILDQPEALLRDVLVIGGMDSKIRDILDRQKRGII